VRRGRLHRWLDSGWLAAEAPRQVILIKDLAMRLLGKRVEVVLSQGDDEVIIVRGQLLGFGQGGELEILEDDGMVHYCWPMLEIRELLG
jgi:hypothetical protein